jgi:hypothetical protein
MQKFICKYVLAYLVKETFHYLNTQEEFCYE